MKDENKKKLRLRNKPKTSVIVNIYPYDDCQYEEQF